MLKTPSIPLLGEERVSGERLTIYRPRPQFVSVRLSSVFISQL